MRKRIFAIVGVVIAIFGLIWFLQGASVLPGSFMTGSQFWEIAGSVTLIIGLLVTGYCLKT
jgi:glucose dehydrogenase